jgi:hypothetical protein
LISSYCLLFFYLEAVQTRYRISKHHYGSFYKDRIQETLTGCLYNEGTRKSKKKATEQQQQQQHDQDDIEENPPEAD